MTQHEQKPESLEFWAQRWSLAALIKAGLPITHEKSLELAEKEIAEAEARGAANALAEQRREDAEGVVAWMYRTRDGSHCVTRHIEEAELEGIEIFPLSYTRPANVAALEARVKELEGALSYLKDEALRFADMYPQSSDMRNTFEVFASKIAARAAAIREGGEHV